MKLSQNTEANGQFYKPKNRNSRQGAGSVSLEFIFIFPLLIAVIYAGAVYSTLFYYQALLQNVVQEAAKQSLSVDRSKYTASEMALAVESRAKLALTYKLERVPAKLRSAVRSESTNCIIENASDIEFLHCYVSVSVSDNGLLPMFNFGWLGKFPPMPGTLEANLYAAF